jgi:hypothetical protein
MRNPFFSIHLKESHTLGRALTANAPKLLRRLAHIIKSLRPESADLRSHTLGEQAPGGSVASRCQDSDESRGGL